MPVFDVVVIGGGAAGFFAAINAALFHPGKRVVILEKSGKVLSKVKVSGGGRCNVTNATFDTKQLLQNYPRGNKELINTFSQFTTTDTINWFSQRNVKLVAEPDGRMFPSTNSSQTIIDCLEKECDRLNIKVNLNQDIIKIEKINETFSLTIRNNEQTIHCKKLIISCGGNPNVKSYDWLKELGHTIEPPTASLFTFNLKQKNITELMGLSVPNATVKINGSKLSYKGPLLITHWGFSGPAILKLSAFGAKLLFEKSYHFTISINWLGDAKEEELRNELQNIKQINSLKKVSTFSPFHFPKRLWDYFCANAQIPEDITWANVSNKHLNLLLNQLIYNEYECLGKTTFKEEFVTCGGIKRSEIDFKTMQSKLIPDLYFAGEIIDVDGITGGFNFQAAWSTGFVAAKNLFIN